ncbi:hypothetical protein vBEcoMWL3_gp063 [Escherichia phage vB_EcoM_WL-3]|nr:hypothetical protein vBEcoMWL3_gp063 [Escherichia phage vB_EcoM_WL-3]
MNKQFTNSISSNFLIILFHHLMKLFFPFIQNLRSYNIAFF